jgi:hypothetical protein
MAIEKLPFPQGGEVQKDAAFEFGKGEDIIPKGFIPNGILRTYFNKDKIESNLNVQGYLYIETIAMEADSPFAINIPNQNI